jgi:hypothetical protein
MACENADTVAAAILAAAAGPAEVSGDAGSVKQQPIKDLIEYEKFLRSKCATTNPHRAIRFIKLVPPGAV